VVPADQSLGRDRKVLRTREEAGDEAGMLKLLFDPETHKLLVSVQ
jgi:hypothetical protein